MGRATPSAYLSVQVNGFLHLRGLYFERSTVR